METEVTIVATLLKPEIIVAMTSTVIAFCALGLSFWQGKAMRDFNKISMQPHLTTWSSKRYDEGIITVQVLNNGVGPALIKKFELRVDDQVVTGSQTEPTEKALRILLPNQPYTTYNAYMGKGFALGAKENCCVISIKLLEGFDMSAEQIEHAFTRADLVIDYESFYGEKYNFDTRKLKP